MNAPTLGVVLVHRNDLERTQIRQVLEVIPGVQIAGERTDLRSGMALTHQVRPTILVLEVVGSGDETYAAATQYRLDNQDAAIFLCIDQVNPDVLMRAMRAGAQEVLRRPLDRGALTEAVERVSQMAQRKQGGGTQRTVTTVFSNKGGVGVTTIATNLALAFRRRSQRSVALIDFDYQSGDVASMLGVVPVRSMGDVLGADRVESATVQGAMMRHPSGVNVLPQPEHIDQADGLTAHYSGRILETVSSMHDIVVVDAPHMFNDVALEIFDRSSQILLVCEMSIPSVRAARRSLELFHRLNYLAVPDRIRLVANRRDERSAITPLQVEETLGMPVSFHVANDYAAVSESINLGRPLCSEHPTSKAGRDIEAMAKELVQLEAAEEEEEVAPRKRLKLFGRG